MCLLILFLRCQRKETEKKEVELILWFFTLSPLSWYFFVIAHPYNVYKTLHDKVVIFINLYIYIYINFYI
jgi:hypothetical protein